MARRPQTKQSFHPEFAEIHAAAEGWTFLSEEEEKKLVQIMRKGNEEQKLDARNRLVMTHLRFALTIARRYCSNTTISPQELAQQAVLGLIRATNRFDASFRFATYCQSWVRDSVESFKNRYSSTVHVPQNAHNARRKARQAAAYLQKKNGSVSKLELARELGLKIPDLERFLSLGQQVSVHTPVGGEEGGDLEFIDTIVDDNARDPLEAMALEQRDGILHQMLDVLTERERIVLLARKGFGRDEPATLEELGEQFSVSRERIRQIEVRAIEKLRECPELEELRSFLD